MKKIKKLLAVLSTITVIATSSAYGVSALEYEVYDVPDSITTMDELKETITEPIYINALDWARLGESMTEEELHEYFTSNGVGEKEAESIVESYYDGLKKISESTCLFPVYPVGQEPERVEPDLVYKKPEYVTGTSGTFESGVKYFYNEETKGLIFDGAGELSEDDFTKAMNSFNDIEFIFFGNDITFECHYDSRFTVFFLALNKNWYNVVERPLIPTYTYEGSEYTKQFDECMKEIGANEGEFKYYTVEDGTDPYTFVNTLEPIPAHIWNNGSFGNAENRATWFFDGFKEKGYDGRFEICAYSDTASISLEEIINVAEDYNITKISILLIDCDMTVLPAELQNCETIEEAEAELLRLINEAKADETMEAVNIGTPTIAGDIDLNEEQGISDIVALTKYNASPELFPISDKTALANADVNQDSVIDSIDTNLLIEMTLGSFESAV